MRILGREIQIVNSAPQREQRSVLATSDLTNPQEWLIQTLIGQAQSATGISVTPIKAMGVACVFACVRVLSDTISSLPLEVYQRKGRQRRAATEHPLWPILGTQPNPEMSSADWRWATQANLSLTGVGYAEIMGPVGLPTGVYPIESNRVDFTRDPRTKQLKYTVQDINNRQQVFGPKQVLHFKNNTFNGLTSLHTTLAVRECIALALALQDNAAKFFGNGSRPNGVLKHPMSLSKPAQDRLKEQFEDEAGGKNLYRLMLLEEGMEYVATRSENKDSQFLESKDAQNLEICRVFGVPPHKVGITGSQPRANIEEENIGFVMDVIRPIVFRWEQELNRKLFSDMEIAAGYCTYFDLDAIMRGNAASRFQMYSVGRQWGILSANDCRAKENLDAVEGGDVLLQPTNMIDSSKATAFLMASKAQAPQGQGGVGGKPDSGTK